MNNSKNETMKEGIIYKAINLITNEVYIGATTKSLEERKLDYIQKSQKKVGSYFQEAIQTYGSDSFVWTEVDSANSINELAEKETEYIYMIVFKMVIIPTKEEASKKQFINIMLKLENWSTHTMT